MELFINFEEAIADFNDNNGLDPEWKEANFPDVEIYKYLYALGLNIGNSPLVNGQIEIAIGLLKAGILDGRQELKPSNQSEF